MGRVASRRDGPRGRPHRCRHAPPDDRASCPQDKPKGGVPMSKTHLRWVVCIASVAVIAGLFSGVASAGPKGPTQRYVVLVKSARDYSAIKARVAQLGGKVASELREIN